LGVLLEGCGIKYVVSNLYEIFRKLRKILEIKGAQGYMNKIETCNLLKVLATKLHNVADIVIGYYQVLKKMILSL
jgi:hypothetical protein